MRERNPRRGAAERLRDALELWRGRPFGELADEGIAPRRRRTGSRSSACTRSSCGSRQTLPSARPPSSSMSSRRLTSTHPYREGFWRQLMLALYRAERQADALAAYHRARTALDEQLGHRAGGGAPGARSRPSCARRCRRRARRWQRHNLPASITSFVGREREVADVAELLREHRLVTLAGVGGVGKTRLGIEVARAPCRGRSRAGPGSWTSPRSPIRRWLPRTWVPRSGSASSPASQPVERMVAHVRERALLLVLDNCEHVREAVGGARQAGSWRRAPGSASDDEPRDSGRRQAKPSTRCRRSSAAGVDRRAGSDPRVRGGPPFPGPCTRRSARHSGTTTRHSRRSAGSAPTSTGCRWRWSWPRPAHGPLRRRDR